MKELLILALLVSCAHEVPLSEYTASVDEVKTDTTSFYIPKEYIPKSRARKISSFQDVGPEVNNKILYFTTLYHQHEKLAKLSRGAQEIKSCPAFHQTWLEFKKNNDKSEVSLPYSYANIIKEDYSFASFPELGLAVSGKNKVAEYVSSHKVDAEAKETVEKAIKNYNQKNYEELSELCDTGVSQNYYIFENMISYYSKKPSFHQSSGALRAFMKMPLITNSVLIDRFKSETDMFFEVSYRNQALARLGANWFENYLYDLKNLRQNLSNITYNEAGK